MRERATVFLSERAHRRRCAAPPGRREHARNPYRARSSAHDAHLARPRLERACR